MRKTALALGAALRRLKICPALKSIRHDLVRWSRKGERLSADQIQHLLSHPAAIADLDSVALRRFAAYLALRWLDDYKTDLHGEYFPFDLPRLAFYRRGLQLADVLSELVASPDFPQRELSTFHTMARHLRSLREDEQTVAAAARLEKEAAMFEELRRVLRLTSRPGQRLLRQREPSDSPRAVEKMQQRLENWRDRLQKRHDREKDEHRRADQSTVLQYLKKHEKQLVGHVIQLKGGRPPLVVRRTNNPAEHRLGAAKQRIRRKVGLKQLTRQIQAMRPEAFLVWNLANQKYVELALNGTLANLPSEIAKHWHVAQAIRKQRKRATTEHPMPTTKQQLRNPQLLENVKQIIATMVEIILQDGKAA